MTLQDGLAVAAIALSIVAMGVSIGAYLLQKRQGERIGVVTVGTVRKMYHRMRYGERDTLSESEDLPDYVPGTSPRYIRSKGRVRLTAKVFQPTRGRLRCVVEDVEGQQWNAETGQEGWRERDITLTFPTDFRAQAALVPGVYDVDWYVVQHLIHPGGHEEEETFRVASDWFGVLP